MKHTTKRVTTYCGLALIFVLGLYAASSPAVADSVRILAGDSAVCSLLGALFLLLRDDIAFERKLILDELSHERAILRDERAHERSLKTQASENAFSIGATSHMASVAFDKHVSFCEEYIAKMAEVTDQLLRIGPKEDALNFANSLLTVRIRWLVWLTPKTERSLEVFETAVRKLGSDAWLMRNGGDMEDRPALVKRVVATYSEILGIKDADGVEVSSERTVQAVVDTLRNILGIGELTELRSKLVERARHNLDNEHLPTIDAPRA
jgi:hypothetical protein